MAAKAASSLGCMVQSPIGVREGNDYDCWRLGRSWWKTSRWGRPSVNERTLTAIKPVMSHDWSGLRRGLRSRLAWAMAVAWSAYRATGMSSKLHTATTRNPVRPRRAGVRLRDGGMGIQTFTVWVVKGWIGNVLPSR